MVVLTVGCAAGGTVGCTGASTGGGSTVPEPKCERSGVPVGRIEATTLMKDVTYLASDELAGRRAGSPEAVLAQRYLATRLAEVGASPVPGSGWRWAYRALLEDRSSYDGVNIIGQVVGTRFPESWVVLSAHYDHLGVVDGEIYSGADDNASGVAALLEITRRLVAEPPEHSVLIVFFDGEEIELSGSKAFFDALPVPREQILLNLNLDMVARGDDGTLWLARSRSFPVAEEVLQGVAETAAVCLRFGHDGTDERVDWSGQGDHANFARRQIPFLYLGVEDHDDYHRPSDDPERINPQWFAASVETIEDVLRAVDRGWPASGTPAAEEG